MKSRLRLLLSVVVLFLYVSCAKEVSKEGPPTPVDPPIGNDCRVQKIYPYDTIAGTGIASLYTLFNTGNQPQRIELFDSLTAQMLYSTNLTVKGDTLRVNSEEYFVNDPQGRVEEYYLLEDPTDPNSDTVRFTFQYNPSGYLEKRELYIVGIPFPLFQYTYTWTAGNLTRVDMDVAVSGFNQKILSADIAYDFSRSPKNFIYFFPDAAELFPYILGLNLGKKSTNLMTSLVVKYYDDAGAVTQTQTTNFSNYKFSSDGYVVELVADGDAQDAVPLLDGLTKFTYFCK